MKNKPITSLSVRKFLLTALVAGPLATLPAPMWGLPASQTALDATVSSKTAGVTLQWVSTSLVNVTSTANNSIIVWNAFGDSVGAGTMLFAGTQVVTFNQPSSTSALLNRVIGPDSTTIGGTINSNGKVFVLNPNGIIVSGTATINAAAIGLSTINEPDGYFSTNGDLSYVGSATKTVQVNGAAALSTIGGTGNVYLAGSAAPGVAGAVTGNLFVRTTGGDVALGYDATAVAGAVLTVSGDASVVTNKGAANLSNSNVTVSGNMVVTTTGVTNGAVSQSAGKLSVDGTGKTLTIDAGSVASPAPANITLTSVDVQKLSAKGANIAVTDSDDIALGDTIAAGTLDVTSTAGNITSPGSVSATGNITLTTTDASKAATIAGTGAMAFTTLNSGTVSITTTGNVTLPNLSVATGKLTVNTSGGNITQSAAITTSGDVSFTASGAGKKIDLTTGTNNFSGNVSLNGGADATNGVKFVSTGGITLKPSNVTGPAEITAASIVLGSAAGDAIVFNSTLKLGATAGTITDVADNIFVYGALDLNASGAVTLDNAGHQFGQIKSTVGLGDNLTIKEATTLNLGAITLAAGKNLVATSTAGSIMNSGTLTVPGTSSFTSAATGDITLTNASNALAGAITIADSTTNLNLTNKLAGAATSLTVTAGKAVTGTTTFAIDSTAGNTLTATGDFNILGVTSANAVTINEANAITLKNIVLTGTAASGFITTNGAITLDSGIATTTSGKITFTAGGTNAGITDSVDGISIAGPVKFASNKDIVINNAGTFGTVELTTSANDGSATLYEAAATDLGAVSIHGKGNLTVQSTGAITQSGVITAAGDTAGTVSIKSTGASSTITLNGANSIKKALSLYANGNTAYTEGVNDLVLGSIAIYGTGTLGITNTAGKITQSSGSIFAYGDTSFTTTNKNIDVSKTGNNFGGLTIGAGSGDVTLKEMATLRLVGLTSTGTVSVTTEAGNITNSGAVSANGAGKTATFAASNGAITLDNAGNALTSLILTSSGNVSIVSAGAAMEIKNGTNIGGTFSVNSTNQNIVDNGTIYIFGDVTLNSGSADISLIDNNNQYGGLKFTGANVTIVENTSMGLRPGSTATGLVNLTSYGNIATTGVGFSSFSSAAVNSLRLNATGTITISAPWAVAGTLTVNASGTKDLSALSLANNLSGTAPINLGTGSYVPPAP